MTRSGSIRSEGGLLPPDLLRRVIDGDAPGRRAEDYGLPRGDRFGESITPAWNRLLRHWSEFRAASEHLAGTEAGTAITNDRWTLPLLRELGFGPLPTSAGPEIAGRTYSINRFLGPVPVHLVGCNVNLDRRSPGVRGAARINPHGLTQEFLNRSDEHLWAVVSNGLQLRLLRDSYALSRQSFLEFDLEAMFAGELYPDFVQLWLTAHATRFAPRKGGQPETCWLEIWTKEAEEQGARALGDLQEGVKRALRALGRGFTNNPKNVRLRDALRSGQLELTDLHGQLLRIVYRLIFLFVAEDRALDGRPLIHPPDHSDAAAAARERYATHYSTARLRSLAGSVKGSRHGDLWRQFRLVANALSGDEKSEAARFHLALPALGGFLWKPSSTTAFNDVELANADFLDVLRYLAFIRQDGSLRPVDYRNLGAEELGGVYESLLALTPKIGADGATFEFAEFAGNERKTSGSYYTPESLVGRLLDSALDPVVAEAVRGKKGVDAEKAILALKVCDPAVGSGHFLIGAARRLARHLSRVRAAAEGESEPSPLLYQRALRDVIGRCLYGVDINPMAAELCRVGLWLEALEPGKPLSFLDHRIRVGDSLLGVLDPGIMAEGIPNSAYKPLTGDHKGVCSDLKKRNDPRGKSVQGGLFNEEGLEAAAETAADVDNMEQATLDDVERKQRAWQAYRKNEVLRREEMRANLFTAAFLAPKTSVAVVPVTEDINRLDMGMAMRPDIEKSVRKLVRRHLFFHWKTEFPEVAASGGFDAVLGNPPWERIKLQDQEFFAAQAPEIARAPSKAVRDRMIRELAAEDTSPADKALYRNFQDAKRTAEATSHFVRESGRFPLTAVGDVNTYALSAENFLNLLAPNGRAGIIVQSGIATDHSTRRFFREIFETGRLSSLYDFENREGLFPGIDSRMKFCLLTLGPHGNQSVDFTFFATNVEHLADQRRHFTLSSKDISRINPNTRTMPVFRSQADVELTKKIYDRVPVLISDTRNANNNSWGIRFMRMFDMANDSTLFHITEQLEKRGARRDGMNWIVSEDEVYVPLYEAKMIHQFDHRWTTFDAHSSSFRDVTTKEKKERGFEAMPRYWVSKQEVTERLRRVDWARGWLMGWRDITNATNERTVIATVFPKAGVGHSLPMLILHRHSSALLTALFANLNSLSLDYVARQKVGGAHLTYTYLKQLPLLSPDAYEKSDLGFIVPRALELTYTSETMEPLARNIGYDGSPFAFDPERRAILRAELDAFYAKLYGLTRKELRFILDPSDIHGPDYPTETFRILKKEEIRRFGEYRTQRLVLEAWDRLISPHSDSVTRSPKKGLADATQIYNVYCNESLYSTHDGGSVTALGVLVCESSQVRNLSDEVRALKSKHRLKTNFEIKWTKVSPSKMDFYLALVNLVLDDDRLDFHGIVRIDESRVEFSRDRFYDELYCQIFDSVLRLRQRYRMYLNVRDTRGGWMIRRLQDMASAAGERYVERIQQVRSRESELLQAVDLLAGALTYANRGLSGGVGKEAIIERMRFRLGDQALTSSFASTEFGFNVSIQQS